LSRVSRPLELAGDGTLVGVGEFAQLRPVSGLVVAIGAMDEKFVAFDVPAFTVGLNVSGDLAPLALSCSI
jgi:hypothetical protein